MPIAFQNWEKKISWCFLVKNQHLLQKREEFKLEEAKEIWKNNITRLAKHRPIWWETLWLERYHSAKLCKVSQILVQISLSLIIPTSWQKKRVWETSSMTCFFMSRGDRIQTCDLALQKHWAVFLRKPWDFSYSKIKL